MVENNISIITVSFNSAETIRRTIESILKQTYLPKQYIVVDGGSSDATIDIIKSYELAFSDLGIDYQWVSERDKGLYDAMNKGAMMASGDWIHFLNSDDYYVNEYVLETVSHYLIGTNASIVYGRTICIHDWKHSVMPDIKESKLKLNMLIGCPIQQPASFYHTSIFADKKYRFDIDYKISADYKLFVQLISEQVKFLFMPVFVTCFSETGISSIHKNDIALQEDIKLLRECGVNTLLMKAKKYRPLYKCTLLFMQLLSKL